MTAYGRDISHLVPAAGTRRRVEALATLGWSLAVQADMLGWDPVILQRSRRQARITSGKAAAVTALYERLWDTQAPRRNKRERITAERTTRMAQRHGWLPPMGLDDDRIDDPEYRPHMPTTGPWDHKPCGSDAAYRRHLRRGEKPCLACNSANRIRKADAEARRKAAA